MPSPSVYVLPPPSLYSTPLMDKPVNVSPEASPVVPSTFEPACTLKESVPLLNSIATSSRTPLFGVFLTVIVPAGAAASYSPDSSLYLPTRLKEKEPPLSPFLLTVISLMSSP